MSGAKKAAKRCRKPAAAKNAAPVEHGSKGKQETAQRRQSARCRQPAGARKATEQEERFVEAAKRQLRPAQCRGYMRRRLAERFAVIVEGFVQSAESGNCQHVKLVTELLESRPKSPKVQKSQGGRLVLQGWLDDLERGLQE